MPRLSDYLSFIASDQGNASQGKAGGWMKTATKMVTPFVSSITVTQPLTQQQLAPPPVIAILVGPRPLCNACKPCGVLALYPHLPSVRLFSWCLEQTLSSFVPQAASSQLA